MGKGLCGRFPPPRVLAGVGGLSGCLSSRVSVEVRKVPMMEKSLLEVRLRHTNADANPGQPRDSNPGRFAQDFTLRQGWGGGM